jgi:hypothetical protein
MWSIVGRPQVSESASNPIREATRTRSGLGQASWRFTVGATVLALVASTSGLLINGIYTGAAATAEMFRAYDLVTALVAVPGLAMASHLALRGRTRARLVAISLLAYLVYTYAYHLFGTGFNDLFVLHAAVFGIAIVALVLNLVDVDIAAVRDLVDTCGPLRPVAGILGLLAIALGSMWVFFAVHNAVTADMPSGSRLVETDTIVHLGMALDLALLVPLYAAAAALVWRRAAWGYTLAMVSLIAGLLHQVSYIVAMPFQTAAEVPGAVSYDPAEPVIVMLYLVATGCLLREATTRSRNDTTS